MSARKSSVQIMKTIPESKQHVRPLSSKMRGVSGSGITFNGEHDFQKRHRKHSHDVSSDTSVGSNDSVKGDPPRYAGPQKMKNIDYAGKGYGSYATVDISGLNMLFGAHTLAIAAGQFSQPQAAELRSPSPCVRVGTEFMLIDAQLN